MEWLTNVETSGDLPTGGVDLFNGGSGGSSSSSYSGRRTGGRARIRAPNSNPHGDGRGEVVHGWRGSRGPIYTSREGPGKAEASSAINGVGVMAETKRINDGRN